MNFRFLKFLSTGGIAAVVNLLSRYVLNLVIPFEVAVVIAYVLGMAVAYVLARLFVFDVSGRSAASEIRRFTVVNIVALAFAWVISVGLARLIFPAVGMTWHADDLAHLIGVMAPAATSYLGHRFYTFSRKETS
jgi:putative flippase GtrA